MLESSSAVDTSPAFDRVPQPLYAFPARAWHRGEYASLAVSAAGAALATVHERDATAWARASMDDLAEHYAGLIREREQGRRPVALLGWSVGGLVAMEVARRLEGEVQVAWIGLVDVSSLSDLRQRLQTMLPVPVPERRELQQVVSRWLNKSPLRGLWESTLQAMTTAQHDLFLREVVALRGDGLPVDGPSPASEEHTLWSRLNGLRLGLDWEPPTQAPARLHRWLSAEMAGVADPLLDAMQLPEGSPRTATIPGTDHLDVLDAAAWHRLVANALADGG